MRTPQFETDAKKLAFLECFRQTGSTRQAAEAAGIPVWAVYNWARRPTFRAMWTETRQAWRQTAQCEFLSCLDQGLSAEQSYRVCQTPRTTLRRWAQCDPWFRTMLDMFGLARRLSRH